MTQPSNSKYVNGNLPLTFSVYIAQRNLHTIYYDYISLCLITADIMGTDFKRGSVLRNILNAFSNMVLCCGGGRMNAKIQHDMKICNTLLPLV